MQDTRNSVFIIGCAVFYALVAVLMPHMFSLIEPDSYGYINFSIIRPALYPVFLRLCLHLGFGLEQITYLQLALFVFSLVVFVAALLRAGLPRVLAAVLILGLLASVQLPSFHWTILPESIFISISITSAGLWIDYLRTGNIKYIAGVSFCVGLLIAVRPAAIALLPMIPISILLQRHRETPKCIYCLTIAVACVAIGPITERVIYRTVHGDHYSSLLPRTLLGKAAMLIQPNDKFTGIYAAELSKLALALSSIYTPVHVFLSNLPSLAALPIETSAYEVVAQTQVLNEELTALSTRMNASSDTLQIELGIQTIKNNISGYIRLSLVYYIGQWSIMVLKFPPTARLVNHYVSNYVTVPLQDKLDPLYLHPKPEGVATVVYPTALGVALITLVLSFLLAIFLIHPEKADAEPLRYIMISAFFSATVHVYTLVISFMNVPTPRYLVAIYPQILLAGLFLLLGAIRLLKPSALVPPAI